MKTSCGLEESEVNRIMEENIEKWLAAKLQKRRLEQIDAVNYHDTRKRCGAIRKNLKRAA